MPKYRVVITELVDTAIELEAEHADEADDLARQQYDQSPKGTFPEKRALQDVQVQAIADYPSDQGSLLRFNSDLGIWEQSEW